MSKDEPIKWYRLDNAAKLYPAIKSRKWTAVFRVSLTLTETVDREVLQQALADATARMGIFSCRLRAGAFWYYFEPNKTKPDVMDDAVNPCIRLYRREKTGYLFRVRAYGRRISLEVFHSVSDGYGGLVFLKTIVAQYLRLKGYDIPCTHGILNCAEPVSDAETEDGFLRYYNKKAVRAWKETRAWRIPGTLETGHTLHIITGICSVAQVKEAAKRFGVTMTEFLVAVYMFALYNIQRRDNPKKLLPVKVSVPVNLRGFFETQTLRNFSSYVNPEINANWGEYTFNEIAGVVHHQLRTEITAKTLASKMSKNVKAEKSLFVRVLPLFLKNVAISMIYNMAGENRITSTMSNLGALELPEEMAAHVARFDVMLGAPRYNRVNCGVCSYKGSLHICFTSIIREAEAEKEFFTQLVRLGIHVKIESNREV
jgi:NRPS condensation-like uncharacterized protein